MQRNLIRPAAVESQECATHFSLRSYSQWVMKTQADHNKHVGPTVALLLVISQLQNSGRPFGALRSLVVTPTRGVPKKRRPQGPPIGNSGEVMPLLASIASERPSIHPTVVGLPRQPYWQDEGSAPSRCPVPACVRKHGYRPGGGHLAVSARPSSDGRDRGPPPLPAFCHRLFIVLGVEPSSAMAHDVACGVLP